MVAILAVLVLVAPNRGQAQPAGSFIGVIPDLISGYSSTADFRIAVTPDQSLLFVSNYKEDRIHVVDAHDTNITHVIPGIPDPLGIATSSDGATLYVAASGASRIDVIDVATRTVVDSYPLDYIPGAIDVWNDEKIVFLCDDFFYCLHVLDLATGTDTALENPYVLPEAELFVHEGTGTIMIGNTGVTPLTLWRYAFDGNTTATLIGRDDYNYSGYLVQMVLHPNGNSAYLGILGPYVIEHVDLTVDPFVEIRTYPLEHYPMGCAADFTNFIIYGGRRSVFTHQVKAFDLFTVSLLRTWDSYSFRGVARRGMAVADWQPFAIMEYYPADGTYGLFQLVSASRPEIAILGNGQPIVSGDTTPSAEDGTDFGSVDYGETVERVFRVENWGESMLTLSGDPRVALSGPDASFFSVTQQPADMMSFLISSFFRISYSNTDNIPATRTATVSIQSNDADETVSTFTVEAMNLGFTGVEDWHTYR